MASSTPVNNVAASFSYPVPLPPSYSSSPSAANTSLKMSKVNVPSSPSPVNAISISWNPHSSLSPSRRDSFLAIYGKPGPRRPPNAMTAIFRQLPPPPPAIKTRNQRLPNIVVSYLDSNQRVRKVTLPGLCRRKKAVVVGVCGAFSTACSSYVKAVEEKKAWSSDLIACVGTDGVDVMRAWGEHLGLGEKLCMVSDVEGELGRALGIEPSQKRFFFTVSNGVITSFSEDRGEEQRVSNGERMTLVPAAGS